MNDYALSTCSPEEPPDPLPGASIAEGNDLRCPFCQSCKHEVYELDVSTWAVYCSQCKAAGPHSGLRQDAIKRWARRR